MSVDTPDAQPESVAEDLTVNDMESIVEIVLEKGLGIDNALEEHDEPNESDAQDFEMTKDVKFFSSQIKNSLINPEYIISKTQISFKEAFYSSCINEILAPPPKA
jgi:hypothetical protein